jgi:potassium/hydrogen antiporter
MDVISLFIMIAGILLLGSVAEFFRHKYDFPDVLLLLLFGFILGPYGLNYLTPAQFEAFAPIFTTFALLFLLFDGAFNIDLVAFAKGISHGSFIMLINFIISVIAITAIMVLFGYPLLLGLLLGATLGGVSSAFVVPLLQKLKIKKGTFSVLTIESAMTDVFCIVAALTIMELIELQLFNVQSILANIATLFAVAGFTGILGAIIWMLIVEKVFKEYKSYVTTIAFLIVVYVVTDFLGGNGAIATLFFGLVLKNARPLTLLFKKKAKIRKKRGTQPMMTFSVTPSEKFFYSEISFLLKTVFFIYIAVLLNLSDRIAIVVGLIIVAVIFVSRLFSWFITSEFKPFDRALISSVYGRGLAAAAIIQIAIASGIQYAPFMSQVIYVVITGTLVLSAIQVFILQKVSKRFWKKIERRLVSE